MRVFERLVYAGSTYGPRTWKILLNKRKKEEVGREKKVKKERKSWERKNRGNKADSPKARALIKLNVKTLKNSQKLSKALKSSQKLSKTLEDSQT